jgi:hypothetical protein
VQHAGPYDDELYTYATAHNLTAKQTFSVAEFTDPQGVVIMMNFVPSAGAATGSSFDFSSGPIIANALFPVTVNGDLLRNGVLFDPDFDGSFAGFHTLTPPLPGDGASHFLWFFGETSYWAPPATPLPGSYEMRVRITDSGGAGWDMSIPFTVAS